MYTLQLSQLSHLLSLANIHDIFLLQNFLETSVDILLNSSEQQAFGFLQGVNLFVEQTSFRSNSLVLFDTLKTIVLLT